MLVLAFLISNFLINKNAQENKLSVVYLHKPDFSTQYTYQAIHFNISILPECIHQLWMPHKRITVTGKPSHFPRLTAKILIFIFFTPLANVSWLNARLRCVEMRFWSQTIIFCLLLVFVSMLHNGFKCFLKEHFFLLDVICFH